MADLMLYFVAIAGLGALMAAVPLSAPRAVPLKVGAVALCAVLMPTVYFGLNAMLSRPKPVTLEWMAGPIEHATVIGAHMLEGEAIFLWLKLPDVDEPRAYRMPWTEEQARALHEAQREAEEQGTEVAMRKPFAREGAEQEPMFHPMPQPAPPPKQVADDRPSDYSGGLRGAY